MDFVFRRTYRGPIRLAVFDWAGTTVDYGCLAPVQVFVDVFKLRGVEITLDEARGPMGLAKKDHIEALSKTAPIAARWREAHGHDCTEQEVTDMYEKDFKRMQVESTANFTDLIPGIVECVRDLRARGIKIGSSSGYFTEAMELVYRAAERQGYMPDSNFCTSDVPAGRPEPWMMYANMREARAFPPEGVIKIGDTDPDIGEGVNAGTWTVGVSKSGNEVGLTEEEVNRLTPQDRALRISLAERKLRKCGAHYVVETVRDLPAIVDRIERRLRSGDRP